MVCDKYIYNIYKYIYIPDCATIVITIYFAFVVVLNVCVSEVSYCFKQGKFQLQYVHMYTYA